LRAALARQSARGRVHSVYVGTAVTGARVPALVEGIMRLLPGTDGDPEDPLSGAVVKVDGGPRDEKIAYLRLFSGTVRPT